MLALLVINIAKIWESCSFFAVAESGRGAPGASFLGLGRRLCILLTSYPMCNGSRNRHLPSVVNAPAHGFSKSACSKFFWSHFLNAICNVGILHL